MAIYPSIFVLYLGRFRPALTAGWHGYLWSVALVAACCLWNLRGAPAVGEGSIGLAVLLLAPFAVFVALGLWRGVVQHPAVQWTHPGAALSTAVLVAMWNYMGWDNASTVAQEVENPQRNYPRAMITAAAFTAITYILPLLAMALAGLSVDSFSTGSWMTAARSIGGPWLGSAVVAGGLVCGVGMFNALMMSYTRLPMAMAEDGMLPRSLARRNRHGVPWVSVLLCGVAGRWRCACRLNGSSPSISSCMDRACFSSSWRWWCCAFASPNSSAPSVPATWPSPARLGLLPQRSSATRFTLRATKNS